MEQYKKFYISKNVQLWQVNWKNVQHLSDECVRGVLVMCEIYTIDFYVVYIVGAIFIVGWGWFPSIYIAECVWVCECVG